MPDNPQAPAADTIAPLALDLPAVGRALSVSARSAWQLVHDGKLRCVRVGVRVIVPVVEIERFLEHEAHVEGTVEAHVEAAQPPAAAPVAGEGVRP